MDRIVRGDSFTEVWRELLALALTDGVPRGARGQPALELPPASYFVLTDPARAILTQEERGLNHAFAAAEFCWIMAGDRRLETLVAFNSRMREYSDDGTTLAGAYGPWVVRQLPYVLDCLSEPDSRQAVIRIGDAPPRKSRDVPCTLSLQFLLRDSRLDLVTTMRSNDLWMGSAYDVPTFCRLQRWVADQLGMSVGAYHHVAGSLHLYERDVDKARAILAATPRTEGPTIGSFGLPDLKAPQAVWSTVQSWLRAGVVPAEPGARATVWATEWNRLMTTMADYLVRRGLARRAA